MKLHNQLQILLELGKNILYERDIHTVLNLLSDTVREILDCERCSIFIHDQKNNELWTTVAHGVDEIRIPSDQGVAGRAAKTKEIQIVLDAYNDFRFNPAVDKKTGYLTKNILTVPLLNSSSEVIGVFQALNKAEGIFSNTDAELLILVGNYASVTLENAVLYKKLRDMQNKLIFKISNAAEFRDVETHKHTIRVGLYCAMMAELMGMDTEEVEMIKMTAPMHDAGKIGIPDAILHKPGKLDEEEFTIMKNHASIGYDILYDDEDPTLQMAARIAREHHEKWDGTGYPLGIKGEDISLEARMTAIADVFDALTSKRPYKDPWPMEKALDLIKENTGKHFDPTLATLFIDNFDRVLEIHNANKDE